MRTQANRNGVLWCGAGAVGILAIITGLAAALIPALAVLVASCSGGGDATTTVPAEETTISAPSASTTVAADDATITIQGFSFGDPITVGAGQEVTVVNADLHAIPVEVADAIDRMARSVDGGEALDGVDQAGVPPHRRGVGLMFQDHVLFPHRDVAGNVAFGLRMQGRPAPETAARVDELLALVDLPGYQDRAVDTLLGGEQ